MGIATLWNTPTSLEKLSDWSFSHAAQHRIEIAAIQRIFGITLTEFRLDPINPADSSTWAEQHQIMENERNAVLGLPGYNLSDVDWTDPGSFEAFIQANAVSHERAATILRL